MLFAAEHVCTAAACVEFAGAGHIALPEAPLWAVLLSSGRALVSSPDAPGGAAALLKAGGVCLCAHRLVLAPEEPVHLLAAALTGTAVQSAAAALSEPLVSDGTACPQAAAQFAQLAAQWEALCGQLTPPVWESAPRPDGAQPGSVRAETEQAAGSGLSLRRPRADSVRAEATERADASERKNPPHTLSLAAGENALGRTGGLPVSGAALQASGTALPASDAALPVSGSAAADLSANVAAEAAARAQALAPAAFALLCALARADDAAPALPPLVAEAVAAIHEGYAGVYGVEEISAQLGVSKSHLVRVFGAAMGVTPGQYLTRVRVDAARQMLLHPEYTLDVVASLCGFSGANYLCKVFKKETGCTPAAWRAQNAAALPRRTASELEAALYV